MFSFSMAEDNILNNNFELLMNTYPTCHWFIQLIGREITNDKHDDTDTKSIDWYYHDESVLIPCDGM